MARFLFLQSILLALLWIGTSSASSSSVIRLAAVSDVSGATSSMLADLNSALSTMAVNAIVVAGDVGGSASTYSSSIIALSQSMPVFWVPGSNDDVSLYAREKFMASDFNVHATCASLAPTLDICGFGGNTTNVTATIEKLNTNATSYVFLSHVGPSGFDTSTIKQENLSIPSSALPRAQWTDNGIPSITTAIAQEQEKMALFVHGFVPQGLGASTYGNVKIINPGSIKTTFSFAITELVQVPSGTWTVTNWKFYRFGNITTIPNLTVIPSDKCSQVTVAAPYVRNVYSQVSIALLSLFLIALFVVGFILLRGSLN